MPPPRSEGTMAAVAFRRFRMFDSESFVGIPVILGIMLGKISMKASGNGTEDTLMARVWLG